MLVVESLDQPQSHYCRNSTHREIFPFGGAFGAPIQFALGPQGLLYPVDNVMWLQLDHFCDFKQY